MSSQLCIVEFETRARVYHALHWISKHVRLLLISKCVIICSAGLSGSSVTPPVQYFRYFNFRVECCTEGRDASVPHFASYLVCPCKSGLRDDWLVTPINSVVYFEVRTTLHAVTTNAVFAAHSP